MHKWESILFQLAGYATVLLQYVDAAGVHYSDWKHSGVEFTLRVCRRECIGSERTEGCNKRTTDTTLFSLTSAAVQGYFHFCFV